MLRFDTDGLPIKIFKPQYVDQLNKELSLSYLERLEQFKAYKRLERLRNKATEKARKDYVEMMLKAIPELSEEEDLEC